MTMDIMTDCAAASMSMHAAALQQSISIAVEKKTMDAQDLAGQEMQKLLPPQNSIIDTYA